MKPIPYARQWIDDDDVAAVVRVLRGDWLTQGPAVTDFEAALANITGAKHVIAVANGTAALHIAAIAAGVEGKVGLTSDITFVASANAIRYANGRPVLVDVDPETGLVSVDALAQTIRRLEAAGTPPAVIIPVDFTGAVAALPEIRKLADRVGAMVIEDAAHSLGATYDDAGKTYRAGSCEHTQMAILSFHPVKHITSAEGGAITTNDAALATRLRTLRSHGITRDAATLSRNDGGWYYEQVELGYNYRITDLQCALGLTQAMRLPKFVARRHAIAAKYDAAFRGAPFVNRIAPLQVPSCTRSSYHLYVVRVVRRADETLADVAARRRRLYDDLKTRGVHCQVHYIPVHSQPDFQRNGLSEGSFAGADALYAGCLSLPMFPAMEDADVDRVIAAVASALEST